MLWAPPPSEQLCWATVSGWFSKRSSEWWLSGGEWGKKWILAFSPVPSTSHQASASGWARGSRKQAGSSVLQSAWQGCPLTLPRPWDNGRLFPHSCLCDTCWQLLSAWVAVCKLDPCCPVAWRAWEAHESWVPSFLSHGSWGRVWRPGPGEPSAEICLLLARIWTLER